MASTTQQRSRKSASTDTRTTIYLRHVDRHMLTMLQSRYGFVTASAALRHARQENKRRF